MVLGIAAVVALLVVGRIVWVISDGNSPSVAGWIYLLIPLLAVGYFGRHCPESEGLIRARDQQGCEQSANTLTRNDSKRTRSPHRRIARFAADSAYHPNFTEQVGHD